MQFWFIHSGEVSVREQIVTQITLGILSHELAPGDRLPSTRELARRFQLHANTVSAAYQQLDSEGWVESRRGSGVFVREHRPTGVLKPRSSQQMLQQIFARFLLSARKLDIPLADVQKLMRSWLDSPESTRFLLIDPRVHLREIVLAELEEALAFPMSACGMEEAAQPELLAGAIVLVMPSKAAEIRAMLPVGTEVITLQVRSAASMLAERLPSRPDALIGIASGWTQFLETTRTMLIAAGISPDTLVVRSATAEGWLNGLSETAGVVCDVLTARRLPTCVRAIPFAVLPETALDALKKRVQAADP